MANDEENGGTDVDSYKKNENNKDDIYNVDEECEDDIYAQNKDEVDSNASDDAVIIVCSDSADGSLMRLMYLV